MSSTKRILLIRSLESISQSAEYLREQGVCVYEAPLIRSQQLNPEASLVRQQFYMSEDVIFLSQNAVTALYRYQGQLRTTQNRVYAIGNRSAELLKPLFSSVWVPEEQTSEGLLTCLKNQSVAGHRVLIIKGEGGRNWLQPQLQKLGAIIQNLDIYRRVPYYPPYPQESETIAPIDAIFVTSGELLLAALNLWGKNITKYLWIVPSERIAGIARDKGINNCINAGSASVKAMYAVFNHLRSTE